MLNNPYDDKSSYDLLDISGLSYNRLQWVETVVSLSNSAVLAQGDLYDLCVFKMWSFVDHWMYRVLQKGMMMRKNPLKHVSF